MNQFETAVYDKLANEKLSISGARTNQAHPDVGNPGVNFCASMPTVACVCNPESIAKISRRCLTCSAITALDRQLLTYQLMAHPDTEAVE